MAIQPYELESIDGRRLDGVVLIDTVTGHPLELPISALRDFEDAELFLAWMRTRRSKEPRMCSAPELYDYVIAWHEIADGARNHARPPDGCECDACCIVAGAEAAVARG